MWVVSQKTEGMLVSGRQDRWETELERSPVEMCEGNTTNLQPPANPGSTHLKYKVYALVAKHALGSTHGISTRDVRMSINSCKDISVQQKTSAIPLKFIVKKLAQTIPTSSWILQSNSKVKLTILYQQWVQYTGVITSVEESPDCLIVFLSLDPCITLW